MSDQQVNNNIVLPFKFVTWNCCSSNTKRHVIYYFIINDMSFKYDRSWIFPYGKPRTPLIHTTIETYISKYITPWAHNICRPWQNSTYASSMVKLSRTFSFHSLCYFLEYICKKQLKMLSFTNEKCFLDEPQ